MSENGTVTVTASEHQNDTIEFRVIKRWALEETRTLLDYVYASTEPMQGAVFGKPLDFATIHQAPHSHRQDVHLRLAPADSAKIQSLLRAAQDRAPARARTASPYDEPYLEALCVMEEEERCDLALVGKLVRPAIREGRQGRIGRRRSGTGGRGRKGHHRQ